MAGVVLDLEIGLAVDLHAAFVAEQRGIDDARAAVEPHPRTVGQHHVGLHAQRRRDAHRLRRGDQTAFGPASAHEPAAADDARHHGRSRGVADDPHPDSPAADARAHVGPHRLPHSVGHGVDSGSHPDAVQQLRQPAAVALRTFDQFRHLRLPLRMVILHDFSFLVVYTYRVRKPRFRLREPRLFFIFFIPAGVRNAP